MVLVPKDHAKSLHQSEERYRILVESVADYAIFLLDTEGRIQSWNRGAERIKGYTADEVIGRHFSVFYPADKIESGLPQRELEGAREQGRCEDEGWRIRKDGSRFWANVVITALHDDHGNLWGFSKVTRDLTERRAREENLRQSEERQRLLIESVHDYALFMLDPDGIVTSWNPGAERIKGYTANEIVGQHMSKFYPPEALERGWPAHELSVARRVGRFEDEGWRVRKDGTRFWANVVITAVHDAGGTLRGFAKVTRDMTERKRVEDLETAERQMNEFLAMLGHELRNPLAPIRNAAAILREGGSVERREWARTIVERQVEHLTHLVDDLLDVSRITRGKVTLRKELLDLAAPVETAIDAIQPVLEKSGQRLEFERWSGPLPVTVDPTRITQVLLNLLGNASKYTREGGNIGLSLAQEGPHAVIRIRDDGIGIAPELLPRIFDLFVQGERSLARSEGGLGVGLTIVRRLVHLHGGTVSVASAGSGRGSEFEIRLPLVEAPVSWDRGTPKREARPVRPGRPLKVLVVDDNPDSTDTMAVLIGIWGHEVYTALDGRSALATAIERRPDVILLDLGLPGTSGYDVAAQLRGTPELGQPLIIAMTGYGQEEDRRRTREAGFGHHLTKPIEPEDLLEILTSLQPS